jgi:hypothetical protein
MAAPPDRWVSVGGLPVVRGARRYRHRVLPGPDPRDSTAVPAPSRSLGTPCKCDAHPAHRRPVCKKRGGVNRAGGLACSTELSTCRHNRRQALIFYGQPVKCVRLVCQAAQSAAVPRRCTSLSPGSVTRTASATSRPTGRSSTAMQPSTTTIRSTRWACGSSSRTTSPARRSTSWDIVHRHSPKRMSVAGLPDGPHNGCSA